MVKVHPTSYVMFNEGALSEADLMLLREQDAEAITDQFVPLSELGFQTDGAEWTRDGVAYGLRVYDAARDAGVARDYITYTLEGVEPENYYLFFGNRSGHLDDGAAAEVARRLLDMKDESAMEDGFIRGVDCSSLLSEEAAGVRYYNWDGELADPLETLAGSGVTHVRVRVWNDPYDENGKGFGGGNCDVENAAALGARAAKYGLKLIVDFHYSDFWADPGKQKAPRAWAGLSLSEKAGALEAFTLEALNSIQAAGGTVGMVQLGNETNGAICGETGWDGMLTLMAAGVRAVRAACPEALIAVHFTNPERSGAYADCAKRLNDSGLDYDVFASSWYPIWHGTLDNLVETLNEVSAITGKPVMVMETSYPYTLTDSDYFQNTIGAGSAAGPWPYTEEGQAEELRAVIEALRDRCDDGLGVCYWEGCWISVGGSSWAENAAKWERCGCGWASSFAAVYDPDDAGRWYGGCAVDNQALFDAKGRPLPALREFG